MHAPKKGSQQEGRERAIFSPIFVVSSLSCGTILHILRRDLKSPMRDRDMRAALMMVKMAQHNELLSLSHQPPEEYPDFGEGAPAPDRPGEVVSGSVKALRRAVDGGDLRLAWGGRAEGGSEILDLGQTLKEE